MDKLTYLKDRFEAMANSVYHKITKENSNTMNATLNGKYNAFLEASAITAGLIDIAKEESQI